MKSLESLQVRGSRERLCRKRQRCESWIFVLCLAKCNGNPVLLPGKFHGQKSLVGYSPWGHKVSDTTEQLHKCNLKATFKIDINQILVVVSEDPFFFWLSPFQETIFNHSPFWILPLWLTSQKFQRWCRISTVGKKKYLFSKVITLTGKTKHFFNFIQKYI